MAKILYEANDNQQKWHEFNLTVEPTGFSGGVVLGIALPKSGEKISVIIDNNEVINAICALESIVKSSERGI